MYPFFVRLAGRSETARSRLSVLALARRLPGGLSVGGSAYVAALNAVDGVDLLYQGADQLVQSGTLTDLRLGMTKEWNAKRFELVLVNNRTNMTQDVHYTTRTFP